MAKRKASPPPGYRAGAHDRAPRADAPERSTREITVEAARELDRRCTDEYAIPPILLMENASIALRDHATAMIGDPPGAVWVIAGPGNNGGDGLALARHLHNARIEVRVFLTHPDRAPEGDPGRYRAVLDAIGVACEPIDAMDPAATPALVVDAILGTGLDRPPSDTVADAISRINALHTPACGILACDIPSGINASTGRVEGDEAVVADRTVTFVAPKPGFASIEAQRHLGDVVVGSIGAPRALVEALTRRIEPPTDRAGR